MNVELISIGDELLIGQTINTNAAWLGQTLTLFGARIIKTTTATAITSNDYSYSNLAKSRT